jgi:hypothetical protein
VAGALQQLTLRCNLLWLMAWFLWWLQETAQQTLVKHRPQVSH